MKKLLFIGTIMLGIASCSGTAKDSTKEEVKVGALINIGDEKTPFYCMTLEAEDGDKTKKKVEFMIDKLIIKDLKLNESKIRNMCQNAILYADWTVKFKPTYKNSESASINYDVKEKQITAFMTGTAENAYGVADNISVFIRFDRNGKMLLDKDGLPDIL